MSIITGKKILLTGGNGFIGTNYILDNINEAGLIFNIDKISNVSNPNSLFENYSNYKFLQLDISDKAVLAVLRNFNIDICIHFAASSHVDNSITNPDEFLESNAIGTYKLLKTCLEYQREKKDFLFIQVSTDEIFGSLNIGDKGFTEESPFKPNNIYSASKASADCFARAFNKTFGLNVIRTNCCNNIGKYQYFEKLVPKTMYNIVNQKPIPVFAKGQNIREWIQVEDHCSAINFLIENGQIGETYNIGSGEEITNIELVKWICSIIESKYKISATNLITFVEDRKGHDYRYSICSDKIRKLGWQPKYNLRFGNKLEETVDFYVNKFSR